MVPRGGVASPCGRTGLVAGRSQGGPEICSQSPTCSSTPPGPRLCEAGAQKSESSASRRTTRSRPRWRGRRRAAGPACPWSRECGPSRRRRPPRRSPGRRCCCSCSWPTPVRRRLSVDGFQHHVSPSTFSMKANDSRGVSACERIIPYRNSRICASFGSEINRLVSCASRSPSVFPSGNFSTRCSPANPGVVLAVRWHHLDRHMPQLVLLPAGVRVAGRDTALPPNGLAQRQPLPART